MAYFELSNMKRKILPNCLKGKYGYHLEQFSNILFAVFGAEMVKEIVLPSKLYSRVSLCTQKILEPDLSNSKNHHPLPHYSLEKLVNLDLRELMNDPLLLTGT